MASRKQSPLDSVGAAGPLEYERISSEFARAIRGQRSQAAFARRIARLSNVAHAWESGRRQPRVSEFLRAATRVGIDVERALREFTSPFAPGAVFDNRITKRSTTELVRAVRQGDALPDLARRAGVSRGALARWVAGTSEPRLPELLRLIDATCRQPLLFISHFVDPSTLPSARVEWERLTSQWNLLAEMPIGLAIMSALKLKGYVSRRLHDEILLARLVGIDVRELRAALAALSKVGLVANDEGRFVTVPVRPLLIPSSSQVKETLRRYYGTAGVGAIGRNAETLTISFVLPLDEDALRSLRDRTVQFVRKEVERINPDAETATCVASLFFQIHPLGSE
jgi:transcriptional regulator with XRE-family HTH domain